MTTNAKNSSQSDSAQSSAHLESTSGSESISYLEPTPYEITMPDLSDFFVEKVETPGADLFSSAERIGSCLVKTLESDKNFYLFSPDETTSNRLGEVFNVSARAWAMPKRSWDLPESEDGRIVEILSENVLFSVMLGHLLAGYPAIMTSYEAFFSIITSQIFQHLKFLEQSETISWRTPIPSANLLSTSTCWRQDHNGFTHQSPTLISSLLSRPGTHVNCLFPADDVSAVAAYNFMLNSKNAVNLMTFNKSQEPRFIDSHHADFQFKNGGASIFEFASDDDPDFIFTAVGDIATREALAAINLLRADLPEKKFRFVGISALTYNKIGTSEKSLDVATFNDYFTEKKPIIANFHGYPETLKHILGQYTDESRIIVHGFEEKGTTTTPFEMLRLNHASRYDLALDVARTLTREDLAKKYTTALKSIHTYAEANGEDSE